ncbi:hypothetical protein MRX96_005132 [Rhipicephalus microplus]
MEGPLARFKVPRQADNPGSWEQLAALIRSGCASEPTRTNPRCWDAITAAALWSRACSISTPDAQWHRVFQATARTLGIQYRAVDLRAGVSPGDSFGDQPL